MKMFRHLLFAGLAATFYYAVVTQAKLGDPRNLSADVPATLVELEGDAEDLVNDFDAGSNLVPRQLKSKGKSKNKGSTPPTMINHPVCYEIKDTWWSTRVFEKEEEHNLVAWEDICTKFDGDGVACNGFEEERAKYISTKTISSEDAKTPCVMLGAMSTKCVSNPCNQLNDGSCTLQDTGGLCFWVNKKAAKKYGLRYGCQRNRCHIGGAGASTDEECEARGIPGLYGCTYCRGKNDPLLKGLGMGCQMTQLETPAECAPINNGVRSKNSIWEQVSKRKCSCSDEVRLCQKRISDKSTGWVLRFPPGNDQ